MCDKYTKLYKLILSKTYGLSLVGILLTMISIGQPSNFNFIPKWEVGAELKADVVRHLVNKENGEVTLDSNSTTSFIFKIAEENEEAYVVHLIKRNIANEKAILELDKSLKIKSQFEFITLKYSVDKKNGKSELLNQKEVQNLINKSIDDLKAQLKELNTDALKISPVTFAPIRRTFEFKENIDSYMKDEFGYILFPYDKNFSVGDTMRVVESCPNPFNPMGSLKQTTLCYISEVNTNKESCKIHSIELIDLNDFNAMMRSMMKSMAAGIAQIQDSNDSIAQLINDEVDDLKLEYNIESKRELLFNFGSSFPEAIVTTRNLMINNQGEVAEVFSTISISFH